MRYSELVKRYTTHMEYYKGCSPMTVEGYGITFAQFGGYITVECQLNDDVKHFNPTTCQGYAQWLLGKGRKSNTLQPKLSALSSLAKYAMTVPHPIKTGAYVMDENPLTRFERPTKQRPTRRYLHKHELDLLMTAECQPVEWLVIHMIVDIGCRVSELVTPNVEDLSCDAKERLVFSRVVKGRGRQQEKVDDVLGEVVATRLQMYLKHREAGPKEPLFVNQHGKRYTRKALADMVLRVARRAGITRIPVRPHALRRTYADLANTAGLGTKMQADLLNHTDTTTVQKYQHVHPEMRFQAREQIRELIRG